MFNEQELRQLIYFLEKAALTGKESMAHALLLQKINSLLNKGGTGV